MITFRGIYPRKMNRFAFANAMFDEMKLLQDDIERDFGRTVSTWKTRPTFKRILRQDDDETYAQVYTENRIYRFLAGGTKKRYAVMTDPFSPKSQPMYIGSRAGVGGFSHMDFDEARAASRAIKARNWDVAIARRYGGRRLSAALRRAMRRGRKDSKHAI